jgi:clan AA aspartic protease
MGQVYADVKLINSYDLEQARRNVIGEEEIKSMHVRILVDTGASMLTINENMQEYLKLPIIGTRKSQLANGDVCEYNVAGPVELHFKDRSTSCRVLVLPGDAEPLLGALPLEELDVIIHTLRQELIPNPDHPGAPLMKLPTLILIDNIP